MRDEDVRVRGYEARGRQRYSEHRKLTVAGEMAPGRRMLRPRRVLLMAAMLSLVCGVALLDAAGRHSSVPVAVHAHGFSQKGLLSLPLAAQGPVSAALGDNNPAYRVGTEEGGFEAASPAQRLASRFSSSGVTVTSGGTRVGLSLRGVGYGSSMTPVGQVAPTLNGNRVLYGRPASASGTRTVHSAWSRASRSRSPHGRGMRPAR